MVYTINTYKHIKKATNESVAFFILAPLKNTNKICNNHSPNNLKYIRAAYNLTQQDVATITGGTNYKPVRRWELPAEHHDHADIPYTKWQMLKNYLKLDQNKELKMTVSILDLGVPNMRRVVSGSLASSFQLDWTKPLSELQQEIELALDALSRTQGFFKNLMMFGNKNIYVHRGGNHIDIVDDSKRLFVSDTYIENDIDIDE